MTETTTAIAEFSDAGASLLHALRQAREKRDISFADLDLIGAPSGFMSKILSPNSQRRLTLQSISWLMAGLKDRSTSSSNPIMDRPARRFRREARARE
jgi:hypothetical protein